MSATWSNWARNQQCRPAEVLLPSDEAEVAAAITRASSRGMTVRAVGSGHSFTDIACTDGVLLDLSRMNRVLEVEGTRVTVEAGIKLHDLGPQSASLGLALENQGDIDAQALAGALATATHGTGRDFGNLSSRVVAMRLVDGSGATVELTEDSTPDLLRAARVSLGALGIVTRVTLECVPLFTLRRHDEPRDLDMVLSDLDGFVDGSDHFEFFVFPYTRTALVRRSSRLARDPSPTPAWRRRLQEDLLENTALGAICRLGRAMPTRVPHLNRLIASTFSESMVEDIAHRVYATSRRVKFVETEFAIPRDEAADAVASCLSIVERGKYPVAFPFEVRFAAADDAYLSTAQGRQTCYIAAHQYRGMPFEEFFREFEDLMVSYGGRPHWGKQHTLGAETLRTLYPHWDRFAAVRTAMDPTGVFENEHLARVLGTMGTLT